MVKGLFLINNCYTTTCYPPLPRLPLRPQARQRAGPDRHPAAGAGGDPVGSGGQRPAAASHGAGSPRRPRENQNVSGGVGNMVSVLDGGVGNMVSVLDLGM